MDSAASDTIQVGALSVRFPVTADDSDGSATVFECHVPASAVMPASADGPPDRAAPGAVMRRHALTPAVPQPL